MRLPYIQIAMEVIEQAAPDVSVELDADEATVGWGLVKMIRWALGRCREDLPPSASSVVSGPAAARQIARAAGWMGDPDAWVDATARVQPSPLLERVDGGIRIRGLDRYDPAWGKSNPDRWAQWKADHPDRYGSKADPKSGRNRAGTETEPNSNRADPGLQTQTQTQTKKQKKKKPPPPTPSADSSAAAPADAPAAVVVEREVYRRTVDGLSRLEHEPAVDWQPTPAGCWEMVQLHRELRGLPREGSQPKGFTAWASRALAQAGPDGVEETLLGYLADETIRAPGYPTAVFIGGIWGARAPGGSR